MKVWTRTLQVPAKGMGAFSPTLSASSTAAFNGQNKVVGMPGTVPVHSPAPAAMQDGELGGDFNQPSNCAPDYFYPSVYYSVPNSTQHFPGKLLSDNVLPVPAGNPGRVPMMWNHRVRVGGRTVTAAVRTFTTWPVYGGK